MGFQDAIRLCFSKYADFTGRAPRSEYWWWVLFIMLGNLVLSILDGMIFGISTNGLSVLSSIFGLATLLPSFAVTARRLHDRNASGWWQLAPYGLLLVGFVMQAINAWILAPAAMIGGLVLAIVLLIWLIQRGTVGGNRFGPDPLGGEGPPSASEGYQRSAIPPSGRD